jgi:hypothetical protein
MVSMLDWNPDELPLKYNSGELSRKTFSQFGLAGLYEKNFSTNIYNAVNHTWPDQFSQWEFHQLPESSLIDYHRRKEFSKWLISKFKIDPVSCSNDSIKTLTDKIENYAFFKTLKRHFGNNIIELFSTVRSEIFEIQKTHRVLSKWEKIQNSEQNNKGLHRLLLYGFYGNLVKTQSSVYVDQIKRIKNRIKRNDRLF